MKPVSKSGFLLLHIFRLSYYHRLRTHLRTTRSVTTLFFTQIFSYITRGKKCGVKGSPFYQKTGYGWLIKALKFSMTRRLSKKIWKKVKHFDKNLKASVTYFQKSNNKKYCHFLKKNQSPSWKCLLGRGRGVPSTQTYQHPLWASMITTFFLLQSFFCTSQAICHVFHNFHR